MTARTTMTTASTNSMTLAGSSAPLGSVWALLTRRSITWREASEGWAVLGAGGALLLSAATLLKVARSIRASRQ